MLVLAVSRDHGAISELRTKLESLAARSPDNQQVRASWLAIKGFGLRLENHFEEALPLQVEARELFISAGWIQQATDLTLALGQLHYSMGNYQQAVADYKDALQFYQSVNNVRQMGHTCELLGIVKRYMGLTERSEMWFTRALEYYQEAGSPEDIGKLKGNWANYLLQKGELDRAEQLYLEAIAAWRTAGNQAVVARLELNLGLLYANKARYDIALTQLLSAREYFQPISDTLMLMHISSAIAELHEATGDHERARTLMEESLRLASSLNVPDVVAERQVQLANILLHMGEYELATKHLEVALESVSGRDRPRLAGIASGHLALARLHGGRTEEAKELITKALGLNEIVALEADRVHLLIIGGRVSLASGDVTAARKMVEQALVYVMHAGMDKELAEIRHLQHELEKKDGNAVEALSALEAYMEVYERILGQQRQRALAILEAELRVKEQNREHKRAMESERRLREHQYSLLVNIVPQQVAERLMGGEQYIADAHTEISIFFLDLVNFTSLASRISPDHVIHLLNNVFLACDAIVLKHGLTKVKTIGDSYMAIAGAPVEQPDNVVRMARAVLEVQEVLSALEIQMPEELGDRSWVKDVGELEVRIGVHCGPVSAGVIGELRMAYDVWGDAVNIAARLEQSGLPGHIQTSAEFRSRLLEQEPGLAEFTLRGTVQIKGKGAMETWWMHRPKT